MDDKDKDMLLAEVVQRAKSNTHRIDALEAKSEDLHELATSVQLLAQNMQTMAAEQKKQGERLTVLEKQPAERWNNMTRTIFTTVISTLAGGFVGALVTLIVK